MLSWFTLSKRNLLYVAISLGIISVAAGILYWMGRVPYCQCGYVSFWHGKVWSSENSQHLTDWYTFSHIIHGFIFYWILHKLFPKMSVGKRLVIATLFEVSWEILENSPFIINRYRESTISLDYFGDSILNSTSDSLACVLGFLLAYRLPVRVTVAAFIIMEIVVGYIIHDNLFLNVVMLLHSFNFIKEWQMNVK